MNKTMKKALSLVLMMIMVISSVPMTSFAANNWCAIGHDWGDYVLTTSATCSTEGVETATCKRTGCGETKTREIPEVHIYGEWVAKKSATCAEAGLEERKCTACDAKETRTTDRLPHTEKEIPAVAATCLTAGSTAGIECSTCKAKIKEVETVAALGHDFSVDKEFVDATCTATGINKGKCSRCSEVKDEVIPAKGHTEETIPGTPADCTNSGIAEGKKCTVCQVIILEPATIAPLGHDLNEVVETPATCLAVGKSNLVCRNCQYTEPKDIPTLEHTFGEWITTKEPTCTESGEMTKTCALCNIIEVDDIPSYGGCIVVELPGVTATCTEPGKTSGSYCERCKTVFAEQVTILPTGHFFVDKSIQPTCTEKGFEFIYCSVCDIRIECELEPFGHSWSSWEVGIEPTCESTGKMVIWCHRCNEVKAEYVLATTPHNYQSEWQTIIDPTCKENGIAIKICKGCFNFQKNIL